MFNLHYIYEYYDGPVQGIADTDIGPCSFVFQFSDEQDDYSNVANLYLIPDGLIDISLIQELPDFPLPPELGIVVDKLVSDIEDNMLTYKKATATFKRIGKGSSSDVFKVDWQWIE